MKRLTVLLLVALCSLSSIAQEPHKPEHRPFDPQRFEQQLEQYVLQKAEVSPAEMNAFLPIYREMRKKQVEAMHNSRKARTGRPTTEAEWEAALRQRDNLEIQLKKIQQTYHNRMLKAIPASKVMKMIRAEEEFHREAFKRVQNAMNGHRQNGEQRDHRHRQRNRN